MNKIAILLMWHRSSLNVKLPEIAVLLMQKAGNRSSLNVLPTYSNRNINRRRGTLDATPAFPCFRGRGRMGIFNMKLQGIIRVGGIMTNGTDLRPENIDREDRQKQMDWATAAANCATHSPCVRLFDDVLLYSQSAMKQYCGQFPEPDRDYSGAPYWILKERTKEVIPMHNIQDIAGFFYWNTDYWEKK